jgi:predicted DNA-binding transcriptional regulator YafY
VLNYKYKVFIKGLPVQTNINSQFTIHNSQFLGVIDMKIDRLLGILTTLLNNDKTKAKELAEKFEVSIRTIHRDIEDICKAGIPVVTYQGGDGGIRIAQGYKFDKNILSNDELSNILIGLKSIESITQGSQVKLLLEKITPRVEDVLSINNSIFIDLSSFYKTSLSHKINTLREAIQSSQEVCFNYYSNKGMINRCIEPYFITFKWSAWYVFGYCKLRKNFRIFKLNRMDALEANNTSFTVRQLPKDEARLDDYFNNQGKTVTLLLDASMEYKIIETYGVGSYEIIKDNKIKFNLEYRNHEYAIQTILAFGDKAEVLSPKSIIDEIKQCAENILNMYK